MIFMAVILQLYSLAGIFSIPLISEMKLKSKCIIIVLFFMVFFCIWNYGNKVIIMENAKIFNVSLDILNKSLMEHGFSKLSELPY